MTKEEIDAEIDVALDRQIEDGPFGLLYRELVKTARVHFPTFLHLLFPQNEDAAYIIGDLHAFLANRVQEVIDGIAAPRQAVSVPPQHGKSRMLAVRATAWLIGHRPGIAIALTGFNHDLLKGFLREVRTIMETPAYKRIFPDIEPVFGRDTASEVEFCNGSTVICKSAGSKLTGRKVDWLVIDDAHAGRAEAESPLKRRRVIEWYFADCVTRLSNGAKVFLIGTRWHPNDLIGHLTSEDYIAQLVAEGQAGQAFEVTNIRAISDGISDPLNRPEGAALFPEQRPIGFLNGIKASIPPYEWDSQFCGNPRTASSGQADLSKLRYIQPAELPDGLTTTRGWDFAFTEKQTADFTAGALCGWNGHTFYIIDMERKQWVWSKMRQRVLSLAITDKNNYNALRMAIEGVSAAVALYQDIRNALLGEVKVTRRNPKTGGKLLRAQPWFNLIEAGRVVIVRGAWNKDFIAELETFPDPMFHDDQIDAVSIAYEELTKSAGALLLA